MIEPQRGLCSVVTPRGPPAPVGGQEALPSPRWDSWRNFTARESEPIMATVSSPSPAKSRATSTRGTASNAAAPDRPARPIPGLYTPRPGDRITVRRNLAPFWSDPCFGEPITVDVVRVRDVYDTPMTLAEFAGHTTRNIGRTWIDGTDELGDRVTLFWEDCHAVAIEYDGQAADYTDPSTQPYEPSALRIVHRSISAIETRYLAGPTLEARLRLLETWGRLREESEDDGMDSLRVRPERLIGGTI